MSLYFIPWNPVKVATAASKLLMLNPRCKCYFENGILMADTSCQYQHYKLNSEGQQQHPPGVGTWIGFNDYDLE